MSRQTSPSILHDLARANPSRLAIWLEPQSDHRITRVLFGCVVAGCGAYGLSIGLWRAPMQGLFVAVKMPALIALTLTVNGLINGMLAVLLESGLSFRQTMKAQLMSFALFALIVGSLSPIVIAMVLDAPPAGTPEGIAWYPGFLLTHTSIIAFAGIVANHKLLRLLQTFSGSLRTGWITLLAWLAGNLFVGAQFSYNLRPFFGNPELPVQFLRPNPFDGSFYEAVWKLSLGRVAVLEMLQVLLLMLLALLIVVLVAFTRLAVRKIDAAISPPNRPPHP